MAKLYFYYGAMGSCKTTQLVTTAYNYKERGMNPLIFTSIIDTRSGENKVSSRIQNIEHPAISVEKDQNLYEYVINQPLKTNVVLVDEVQFFTPRQIEQLSDIVDLLGIPVLCYGLRADFKTRFFEGSGRLLELADEIFELKTMCHCGRKAIINARLENGKVTDTGDQIQIGDIQYSSMCRRCYKKSLTD